MNEPIETIKHNGHTINIYPDHDAESPREWDNLGTMLCFHKRYVLGDKHDLKSDEFYGWEDVEYYIEHELDAAVILPLYIYDHGGVTISTTPFSCPWDSGQVGFIYISKEKIRKEFGIKKITQKVKERMTNLLLSEVKTYDMFLTGQVYGYEIEGTGDSCWGFYGEKEAIEQAKEAVGCLIS